MITGVFIPQSTVSSVSLMSPKSPNSSIISDDKMKQILNDDEAFKLFTIQQLEKLNARISYLQSTLFYALVIILVLILISNPHVDSVMQSVINLIK